jgi:hypothetical protein
MSLCLCHRTDQVIYVYVIEPQVIYVYVIEPQVIYVYVIEGNRNAFARCSGMRNKNSPMMINKRPTY